jgi:hypothetical protein
MYGALLHCSTRANAGDMVCIVVARASNRNEYIRMTDPENATWGTVPTFSWANLVEQDIRVPVEPNGPPLTIFYGFWLRTLQPLGHADCQITVLSNCEAPGADYVCQQSSARGNTGITCTKPKNSSGTSK